MARPETQPRSLRRHGFTLTELLIVIALIVLMIALAVPVFKALSGGRSTDAARNQISAVLGRARMEAIGLQRTTGILFIKDGTNRIGMVLVTSSGSVVDPGDSSIIYPGLDAVPEREILYLPVGVNVQTIDNAEISSTGKRMDDSYIGFQKLAANASSTSRSADNYRFGGVILFDGQGRLVSNAYAFRLAEPDPAQGPNAVRYTQLGEMLKIATPTPNYFILPHRSSAQSNGILHSQLGFVLFDAADFAAKFSTNTADGDADWQLSGGGGSSASFDSNSDTSELSEEQWIEDNGEPVLLNRYSGALMRGA